VQLRFLVAEREQFTKKFEEKSFQFIQKRQILESETPTRMDAARELPIFGLFLFSLDSPLDVGGGEPHIKRFLL